MTELIETAQHLADGSRDGIADSRASAGLKLADLVLAEHTQRFDAPHPSIRKHHIALLKLLQRSGERGEKLETLGLTDQEVHRIDMLSEWLRALCDHMDERPGERVILDTTFRPPVFCGIP